LTRGEVRGRLGAGVPTAWLDSTVFLFEAVICDELVGEGLIDLCGFDDLRP